MLSLTVPATHESDDYHEHAFVGKAYCAGIKSNEICCELTDEVFGVQWHLSTATPFSQESFEQELINTDLLVIIADTADRYELEQCSLMAKVGHNQGIIVFVYTISTADWKNDKCCPAFEQLSYLMEVTNIFHLDDVGKNPYLLSNQKYKTLTTDLVFKLRAIIEPVSLQAIVGVDYSDVRSSLNKKGLCQTFVGYAQGKNKVHDAFSKVKENLPTEAIIAAQGIIITLFAGLDFEIEELDKIHSEFVLEAIDSSNAMIVVGVVIEPELLDKRVISIVVA